MAENLGAFLRQHEEDHAERLRYAENQKQRAQAELIQLGLTQAQSYLDSLRQSIPEDAKKESSWSSEKRGMTYVIPERASPHLCVHHDRTGEYWLQDRSLWDNFVSWAKEHGLRCTLESKSHYETNGGDEMWSEHDYYYILLRPL